MNTQIENNILINTNILKGTIANIVRQTPGIGETTHFFSKSIKGDNNENKVIDVEVQDNHSVIISFSISITHPNLIVEIPKKLQEQIYNDIKKYFNIESTINIKVIHTIVD